MTAEQIDELKKEFLNKKVTMNGFVSTCTNEKVALEHALKSAHSNMIRLKGKQVVPPNTTDVKSSHPNDFRNKNLPQTQRLLISQKSKCGHRDHAISFVASQSTASGSHSASTSKQKAPESIQGRLGMSS